MSEGRRTLKLKTQRECSLCGEPRIWRRPMPVATSPVLICLRCDRL